MKKYISPAFAAKIKTPSTFSNFEIMWSNTVESDTPQITIWYSTSASHDE